MATLLKTIAPAQSAAEQTERWIDATQRKSATVPDVHGSRFGAGYFHQRAYSDGVEFDEGARKQVANMAALPFVHSHVAVMPDVHLGRGATVGSVIPTLGAIVPAAVGVDIGCGMIAQKLTLLAEEGLLAGEG